MNGPYKSCSDQMRLFQKRISPVYAPGECLPFLGQEVEVGGVQPGHHAPVVAPPSLHHHEQVEVRAAGAVIVLFKVIPRVFHESFQFAGQQHLGEYGAVVVGRLVGGVVSDGERDAGGGVRRVGEAERQLHRLRLCLHRFHSVLRRSRFRRRPVRRAAGQDHAVPFGRARLQRVRRLQQDRAPPLRPLLAAQKVTLCAAPARPPRRKAGVYV